MMLVHIDMIRVVSVSSLQSLKLRRHISSRNHLMKKIFSMSDANTTNAFFLISSFFQIASLSSKIVISIILSYSSPSGSKKDHLSNVMIHLALFKPVRTGVLFLHAVYKIHHQKTHQIITRYR